MQKMTNLLFGSSLVLSISLIASSCQLSTNSTMEGIYFSNKNVGWIKRTQSPLPMSKSMPTFTYVRSTDGGMTWADIGNSKLLRKFRKGMYFLDEMEGWSVQGGFDDFGAVFHTLDAGASWSKQYIPGGFFEAVQFTDRQVGWLVGGGIYKTSDGGKSWQKQAEDLGKTLDLHSVYFLNEQTGWACGTYFDGDQSRLVVLSTKDGGDRWTLLPLGSMDIGRDIFFADEQTGWLLAGFTGNLLKTTDGGITWNRIYMFGDQYSINSIYFVDGLTGWAVGSGGIVFKTSDGGRGWEKQP
jgi:photosystem II stability/assembly factor-like uncharacterized protein